MKKVIVSVGLVALGMSSVEAASSAVRAQDASKPWNMSLALRGFYDDNYTSAYTDRQDSFGLEVQPSIGLNYVQEATSLTGLYTYGLRYYPDRDVSKEQFDQSHVFDLRLVHNFSDKTRLQVIESFAAAQEPSVIENPDSANSITRRVDGSNIRNFAGFDYDVYFTERFGISLNYRINVYNYHENGVGSYSAKLDRRENLPALNLRYNLAPDSVALTGFQYGDVAYVHNQSLVKGTDVSPSKRNTRSYYYYVGLDQTFNPKLSGAIRAGAMTVHYYNQDTDAQTNPYADLSVRYLYAEGSSAQIGGRYSRNATDVVNFDGAKYAANEKGYLTLDAQTWMAYVNINHAITSKLIANGLLSGQGARFRGGSADGQKEYFVNFDLGLSYEINKYFTVDGGYQYSWVPSDLPNRAYHRNFLFLGVKGTL